MLARLIAYVPEGPAIAHVLAPGSRLLVGRDTDADVAIAHASISRRHARIEDGPDGWRVLDLDSKNGSFVDGARVVRALLPDSAWLRFGEVPCEFAMIDAQVAQAEESRWLERCMRAAVLTASIDALGRSDTATAGHEQALLDQSLRAVVELAQCARGYGLVVENGRYRVAASLSLDAASPAGPTFHGCNDAVMRALNTHAPVVCNDLGQDAWPVGRHPVADTGLRAVVAMPMMDGMRPVGLIYADRRAAGPPVTALDIGLIQPFVDRCAPWLMTGRHIDAQGEATPPRDAGQWSALPPDDGKRTR